MNLEDYEHLGDPEAEVTLTRRHHRQQQTAEDIAAAARRQTEGLPPLPLDVVRKVVAILAEPTPPSQLMRWQLRLYCGHVVLRQSHASHKTAQAAFGMGRKCEECGKDPATIVAARPLGLVEQPETAPPVTHGSDKRRRIERRVRELEAELIELRRQLEDA